MTSLFSNSESFMITIEVVPPRGYRDRDLLNRLGTLSDLPFDRFNVATNPVARAHMSASIFAARIQQTTGTPSIFHLTVRDQNQLSLQSELWGARALGIDTVVVATGDPMPPRSKVPCWRVNELSVFELISLARNSKFTTGAVLDFRPEQNGLAAEVKRLEKKVAAGCQFAITQPVFDEDTALTIQRATAHIPIPMVMGILPLISHAHARFLHTKVDGIWVPQELQDDMETALEPAQTGIQNAKDMLALARNHFSGACIMPPFERFDILNKIF